MYIYTRLHVCTYAHAHARTHTCPHTYAHTRARAHARAHARACARARARSHAHTHKHTHTHTHIHMHAHTQARIPPTHIPILPLWVLVLYIKTLSERKPPSGTTRVPLSSLFCTSHSYVGHDAFVCGTCLHYIWDRIQSYVGHDLFYVERDSFICGI